MMGTFAAMLAKKRIPTPAERFRADVSGDIEAVDGVLKITRIAVRYTLQVDLSEAAKGARKRVTLPGGTALDLNVPAGVDDGRILRLNADLSVLMTDQPVHEKNRWLNHLLEEKVRQNRIRFYREPVYLLDE